MTPILFSLLFACANEQGRVDDILALDGDPVNGEAVFAAECATCHAEDGTGGSGPNIAGGVSPEKVAEFVLFGEEDMPAYDGDLEDQDIADVVAFVSEVL